ncbi:MAG: pyridoxal-phosphate dependent enzyme, partial [Candidatus Marinimicrobia bacterium]|nr:pyridoxal-phosphate dependent enzyme [Candidatus Neomarinimicrobiota bacterium]
METIPEEFFSKYPALKLIGSTDLVEIDLFANEHPGIKISAKAEWLNPGGSVKDRPVLRMLAMAMLSGELKEGQVILDSSSGNAGIAYAMIGAILGI